MKKAIDIVLLPPDDIIDMVVEINNEAYSQGKATIKLGKNDRIPHLSLLMGVMDENDLEAISAKMTEIAKKFKPIKLTFNRFRMTCFWTKNEGVVRELHELLVKEIDPLLGHDAKKEMYDETPEAELEDNFYHWVNEFVNLYSFNQFGPHITVHAPDAMLKPYIPFSCTFDRFALTHLGKKNLPRKILIETKLDK